MFNYFNVQKPAAPFQCPLAPFAQPLSPAFGRISDMDFFPEGLFLSSKTKAAAFFDASVETLDKWIAKKMITPYKRGRVYFFSVAALAQAMNDPRIMDFIKKKALTSRSGKKVKSPSGCKVKYWIEPIEGGKFMFIRIRCRGVNIVWFCRPVDAPDKKELEAFISEVILLYFYCQSEKASFYERN